MDGEHASRDEVARGLEYSHRRAGQNTAKILEIAAFAYGTVELLAEKGIITIEELDERKKTIAARLGEKYRELGMGVVRSEPDADKYAFEGGAEIDCENRVHLCHAACCRLQFALTRQDVEEGVVKWEFGRPYMIRQDEDGYCTHLERGSCRCGVYERRPLACRAYDCRKDDRIWADFEARVPSPKLDELLAMRPARAVD